MARRGVRIGAEEARLRGNQEGSGWVQALSLTLPVVERVAVEDETEAELSRWVPSRWLLGDWWRVGDLTRELGSGGERVDSLQGTGGGDGSCGRAGGFNT